MQIENQKSTLMVYFSCTKSDQGVIITRSKYYSLIRHTPQITKLFIFSLGALKAELSPQISVVISRPFLYTKSVHYFPLKNLKRKPDVHIFEHQFGHEVVGLETKFFWLPLTQQISALCQALLINLSD